MASCFITVLAPPLTMVIDNLSPLNCVTKQQTPNNKGLCHRASLMCDSHLKRRLFLMFCGFRIWITVQLSYGDRPKKRWWSVGQLVRLCEMFLKGEARRIIVSTYMRQSILPSAYHAPNPITYPNHKLQLAASSLISELGLTTGFEARTKINVIKSTETLSRLANSHQIHTRSILTTQLPCDATGTTALPINTLNHAKGPDNNHKARK